MKKTNIPIYIMYLWAALVLAACTGDDDAAWPEGGVPLELYAAVEGYSSANAQTRATTENRWEGGEVVRLWIRSRSIGSPNEIHLSVDSDGKLITNDALCTWISPDEEKIIYGEYHNSQASSLISVQADQRDKGYQDSDCMAAPRIDITVTSPDKTLVFRHVTAKVVVHLKVGNGVTDDELQRATVTFENLTCTGGNINRNNGTAEQVLPAISWMRAMESPAAMLQRMKRLGRSFRVNLSGASRASIIWGFTARKIRSERPATSAFVVVLQLSSAASASALAAVRLAR